MPFVERLDQHNVNYYARSSARPPRARAARALPHTGGPPGSPARSLSQVRAGTNYRMHSVLLNIPFTGLTVEVTSDQGLRGAQSNRFRYLPPRTCPPALHLRGNPSQLKIELSGSRARRRTARAARRRRRRASPTRAQRRARVGFTSPSRMNAPLSPRVRGVHDYFTELLGIDLPTYNDYLGKFKSQLGEAEGDDGSVDDGADLSVEGAHHTGIPTLSPTPEPTAQPTLFPTYAPTTAAARGAGGNGGARRRRRERRRAAAANSETTAAAAAARARRTTTTRTTTVTTTRAAQRGAREQDVRARRRDAVGARVLPHGEEQGREAGRRRLHARGARGLRQEDPQGVHGLRARLGPVHRQPPRHHRGRHRPERRGRHALPARCAVPLPPRLRRVHVGQRVGRRAGRRSPWSCRARRRPRAACRT